MRALATALTTVAVVFCAATGPADAAVTFDIGTTQAIDSLNPLVGVTAAAFEVYTMQYATLTTYAPKDFSPAPALAESWRGSADGKTWTYTLRPGLRWSDGEPLTSADVAFTINRARDDEWLNYTSVTERLTASAPDPRTVVIRTSEPDPRLPGLDAFILPEHVWGKLDADAAPKYVARDGVGSGPFVLERYEPGQSVQLKANPHFYGGVRPVDRVVLRMFNNPDAMVAALEQGELDFAEKVPGAAFRRLERNPDIVTVRGEQGSSANFALNGGAGLALPHPALRDIRVRQAIAHAIDKRTLVARVMAGLATPADALAVSPDATWTPVIPPTQRFDYDPARANRILDAAGYADTDGDGIRELPGGGRPLRLRYAVRSEGETGAATAELIAGWLRRIGIATTRRFYNDSQLTTLIGKGAYDAFSWGWTPYVDPDQMLQYFTCDQVADDPANPTDYYNDANWCDPRYDGLYERQNRELDRTRRIALVHEMLARFYASATYNVLYTYPDLQAYRRGRFTGWTRLPERTGPVLFSSSGVTYARLRPVAAAAAGVPGNSGGPITLGVLAAAALAAAARWAWRRRTIDERE